MKIKDYKGIQIYFEDNLKMFYITYPCSTSEYSNATLTNKDIYLLEDDIDTMIAAEATDCKELYCIENNKLRKLLVTHIIDNITYFSDGSNTKDYNRKTLYNQYDIISDKFKPILTAINNIETAKINNQKAANRYAKHIKTLTETLKIYTSNR